MQSLMAVFEMAVDTIFICYCIDMEANDGSKEKPYYGSRKFMRTMLKLQGKTEEQISQAPGVVTIQMNSTANEKQSSSALIQSERLVQWYQISNYWVININVNGIKK